MAPNNAPAPHAKGDLAPRGRFAKKEIDSIELDPYLNYNKRCGPSTMLSTE